MKWTNLHDHGEHSPTALGTPGFDLLRAIVSARQTATPTVRALAAAMSKTAAPDELDQRRIRLLSHGQAGRAGQFRNIETASHLTGVRLNEADHAVNQCVSTNVESCAVEPGQPVDDRSQFAGARNA